MEELRDEVFDSEIISMDDRKFTNCTFHDCELQYSGGVLAMNDCNFERCSWSFGGAALRTIDLLDEVRKRNSRSRPN